MKHLRAALYARVSTDKGDKDPDKQNPESQLLRLRRWAPEVRGWPVVGEFCDKVTGDLARRRGDPPGLRDAIAMIARGQADVLCIVSAERLVRSPFGLLQLVARIEQLGGKVASIEDGGDLDTTTDSGELNLILRGWFARMWLRLNRAHTKAGLDRARAEGKRLGRPPVGLSAEDLAGRDTSNVSALARELGMSRRSVQRRLAALRENPGPESAGPAVAESGPDRGCA